MTEPANKINSKKGQPNKIIVATCQFAVSDSITKNSDQIQQFINQAARAGADIVHFSETALSGYAGMELKSFKHFNWERLAEETANILNLAQQTGIWVVLGSTHRLTENTKPHNSLYLINPQGKIQDRYDKRFLTYSDLEYYTAGDHFVTFDLNNVKCALLICFDLRFPELYRQLALLGVQCVFQSFYNARQKTKSVHTHIMRQTMQCRAASNFMWVSMTNSCRYYSPYPSCFIQPDGVITQQLRSHRPGIMINTIDTTKDFYDPTKDFRMDVIKKGTLTNGQTAPNDPRSKDRKCY